MDIDPKGKEWSGLWTLLGAYFHQDFEDIHGSPEDTVLAFCRESTSEQLSEAAEEVRTILDGTADDDDTLRALEPFGRDYHPESAGWSIREWLAELERVLRDPSRPTRLDDRPGSS